MASKKSAIGVPSMPAMDRDYQAEDDHRTLSRAAEIQSDKSRMAGVKKHHRKVTKQMSAMSRTMLGGKR